MDVGLSLSALPSLTEIISSIVSNGRFFFSVPEISTKWLDQINTWTDMSVSRIDTWYMNLLLALREDCVPYTCLFWVMSPNRLQKHLGKPKLVGQLSWEVCCHFTSIPRKCLHNQWDRELVCKGWLGCALQLNTRGRTLTIVQWGCLFLFMTFLFQWQLNVG